MPTNQEAGNYAEDMFLEMFTGMGDYLHSQFDPLQAERNLLRRLQAELDQAVDTHAPTGDIAANLLEVSRVVDEHSEAYLKLQPMVEKSDALNQVFTEKARLGDNQIIVDQGMSLIFQGIVTSPKAPQEESTSIVSEKRKSRKKFDWEKYLGEEVERTEIPKYAKAFKNLVTQLAESPDTKPFWGQFVTAKKRRKYIDYTGALKAMSKLTPLDISTAFPEETKKGRGKNIGRLLALAVWTENKDQPEAHFIDPTDSVISDYTEIIANNPYSIQEEDRYTPIVIQIQRTMSERL